VATTDKGQLDADSQQLMESVGTLLPLTISLEKGKDYDYTPGDAKLGDSNKIVFWHRTKDQKGYRAIFGDLTVTPVQQADLPKPAAPAPSEGATSVPATAPGR
jgi:hypothetical protein